MRFIKAIKLEEPDRVPVMLPTGNYPAYWGGSSFHELCTTTKKAMISGRSTWSPSGIWTLLMAPALSPPAKYRKSSVPSSTKLPGLGLPKEATMNQFVEGEYMMADEYDRYMLDPTDYNLRVMMPRTTPLFESFKKLPAFSNIMGNFWVMALTDPDVRKTFETLLS